ncbi:MAG: hypothetical protein RSB38_08795, partial [Oscillospiraceae bacterium]
MKRKVIALLTMISLILSGLTVFATNGDIKQTLYTTDIITQFDNKQIKGYSLDGRMMIALEDLADYGYTVNYDNDNRMLFVNKTH